MMRSTLPPSVRLLIALIVPMLAVAAPASAQTAVRPPVPATTAEPADPRLPVIPYDPSRVVSLRAALNHQVTVVFAPGEGVDTVAIGDSDGWEATLNQRGDALVLKPLRAGGPTNMTILTDARVYTFLLTTTGAPMPDTPFVIRFQYPDDAGAPPPAPPGRWRIGGAGAVRPAAVRDDGRRTYLQWRPDQAIPAIFSVDDRGRETLLDAQVLDGASVLHAVPGKLLFRLDGQTARADRRPDRSRR